MEITPVSTNIAFQGAISNFSFSLFNALDTNENVFISPFSISAVLLMLSLGTDGKTKMELETTLCGDANIPDIHSRYKNLYANLFGSTEKGITLSLANRLFVSNEITLLDTYIAQALQNYNSEAKRLDFKTQTESSRLFINNWIANQTNDKILDMIQRGVLTSDTLLVIANAIYFKGTWKTTFEAKDTSIRFFYNSKTATPVFMMHGQFSVRSGENFDYHCKALQLPYVGDNLSMVFILPTFWNGLSQLESKLSYKALKMILAGLRKQETVIRIPKFSVKSEFKLKKTLSNLGIADIFQDSANFSKMFAQHDQRTKHPHVSKMLHKAFVDVSEHGSEAAAATLSYSGSLTGTSLFVPFEFVAEHPFMYLIIDNISQTVLFMGRYVTP